MTGKRTRYSAEFKAKVALEALRGLTVVGVDGKRQAGDLAVLTGDFQPVRGPTQARDRGDHSVLVRPDRPPGAVSLQE